MNPNNVKQLSEAQSAIINEVESLLDDTSKSKGKRVVEAKELLAKLRKSSVAMINVAMNEVTRREAEASIAGDWVTSNGHMAFQMEGFLGQFLICEVNKVDPENPDLVKPIYESLIPNAVIQPDDTDSFKTALINCLATVISIYPDKVELLPVYADSTIVDAVKAKLTELNTKKENP